VIDPSEARFHRARFITRPPAASPTRSKPLRS
jgi:hypothetical protein